MKKIGQRLKNLRKSLRLTQAQMADILEVKQSSISKYEKGDATPDTEILRRYADYFDVSLDYIFARIDDPHGNRYESNSKFAEMDEKTQKIIQRCFDPKSSFYLKMKQMLLQMLEEENNR